MKKIIFTILIMFYAVITFAQTQLTQVKAVSIFENLTQIKPIKCIVAQINNKQIIICLADKRGAQRAVFSDPDIYCYRLSLFANTWEIESQEFVFKETNKYCQFLNDPEIVTVDNEPYLYFTYTLAETGNAAGDIETLKFSLFTLNKNQLISLDYEGDASYDKNDNFQSIKNGNFLNIETLKSNPDLLNFFEDKASKSSFIYHPTEKDLDINDPDNFEKKWTLDNPQAIKNVFDANKQNLYNEPLHITYYDKNLFEANIVYVTSKAENLSYKFIALFRNSILGYNKQKKKYFALWVDSCINGCEKKISLINPTTLKIVYTEANDQTILVNLTKMTYSLSYKTVVNQNQLIQPYYPSLKTDYFKTLGQPIFLYKSASFIKNILAKDKAWHYDGYMQNDLSMNVLTFSHNYQPKNSVGFQATYYYWISGDQNLCLHFFIEFPSNYLKYMLSKFNGFVIVDESHLLSKDREVGVSASINNGMCNMEFYRNN